MNPAIPNSPGRAAPPLDAPTVRLPAASGGRRIGELDALRGLALCGILFVNIAQILYLQGIVDFQKLPIPHALDMFVQQRFFPIFSLLFGVGFGIFLGNASQRTARPRVVLLRRLLVLAGFGVLHHFLQPGEALLPYAIFGLVVLLPMSFLPWWANLPIAVAMTAATLSLTSGGMLLIPCLLLTGFALAQAGLPAKLPRLGGQLAAVFAVSALAGAGFLVLQEQNPLNAGFNGESAAAGLFMAIAYSAGFLLLLRTPASRVLSPVLEPLGKMALTNYVTATLLIIPFGHLLGMRESTEWELLLAMAAGIILVQVLWSRWWLARFQYGPMEWVWRCATWWRIVPFRRKPSPAPRAS
ncbi:Uncharacterized membrane protein YeiB [Saccharopolyspora kobensis]|uniref:Uncharacterized membrane protein YeiB n=1 Tax=Saccharopolyspora kobensis TaxID=146035 RepID=A0A1H5TA72_9PSEU|nr:DUF418 domain-containing protein [Saccharopolyspora kobensis]SEF59680.1 Uncharacterized membrane protein YeiB [Saccharopolyspora kobensis]SFC48403.1 Uncharacterized membrane protein YeiB [Saccharopolyspora kobensis]